MLGEPSMSEPKTSLGEGEAWKSGVKYSSLNLSHGSLLCYALMSRKASISTLIMAIHFYFVPISCIEFVFNSNFSSTNLLLVGSAVVEPSPRSILTLTNDTVFEIGRGLYPSKIAAVKPNSSSAIPFATSFIFSVAPYKNLLPGHGFVFVFLPAASTDAADPSQHLGLVNFTNNGDPENRIFGVEFDVFENQEFDDINDNHVGIDLNSLKSLASERAGFWGGQNDESFKELKINNGVNYQVWIDFDGSLINVTMAKAGTKRPKRPLISNFLNLTGVLLDEMYVGFTGSTGQLVQSHKILAWSFSNSNFSIGDALITTNLPSFVPPSNSMLKSKGFIIGVSVGGILLCVLGAILYMVFGKRLRRKRNEDLEAWETEYWPHRIPYQEIRTATNSFSDENVIGYGGNGKVYKGVLAGTEVAVKRINPKVSENGTREFFAEVSSLGRLTHRNLVGLKGWCRNDEGSLVLVYDYMENGSVDKKIFDVDESLMLSWGERMKVLKDVASGIEYLHEGWETKVVHRDIKSSNVLLDKEMNARLGDFGLAKLHHGDLATTTRVVGTAGYMAPEIVRTGRASVKTDVFGYGVLVLEVVCGRRPIEEGKPNLLDWVWGLMETGELATVIDERLKPKGGYFQEDVERILQLGMLCAYPDPGVRPSMREVLQILDGRNDENGQFDRERMDVHLLERVGTTAMWNFDSSKHPTFKEIQNSPSFSGSLSSSYSMLEGR